MEASFPCHILSLDLAILFYRNEGNKKNDILRRWERQLSDKQRELESMCTGTSETM